MRQIIFVCTGNTCRSPIAEGIFNVRAKARGMDISAISRGIAACDGDLVTDNAVEAARKFKADISGHVAHMLTNEDAEKADMIFFMTKAHRNVAERMFGEYKNKFAVLSEDRDISDPYGWDQKTYDDTAKAISDGIDALLDRLSSKGAD